MKPFAPILDALANNFPGLGPADFTISAPPKPDLGDIAIPLFIAAKKLKAAPPKLATEATTTPFGPEVTAATATGPYLNLKLDRAILAARIIAQVFTEGPTYGSNHRGKGRRALLEHTSINPNAEPHVGRARCAMIGDSLARLLRFQGYDLEVHYYVNDMGKQIGLLVLIADELENITFDQILDAYVRANARAETDPEFAERGYEMLAKMEQGDPATQDKFRAVVDLCLHGQLQVLARIGATYDVFDRESRYVDDPRLEQIVQALTPSGAAFTDEEKRLVVDLSKLGYPHEEGRYFVLRRANGSSMYGFRDLAYNIDKEAHHADLNLTVLGEDHKLYQQQLTLILETAGHTSPETVYASYVLLRDGKMSTRAGTVVLLSEFLDQAEGLSLERVQEQCKELAPEEQAVIAKQVAVAAIRFAILRVAPNKNVTFDMESSLAFNGDTGPYIQYCCARINSILRKHAAATTAPGATESGVPAAVRVLESSTTSPSSSPLEKGGRGDLTPPSVSQITTSPSSSPLEKGGRGDLIPLSLSLPLPLTTNPEWALLLKLAEFPSQINTATTQRTIAPIANYLLELAHAFTAFYHDCPVLTAPTEDLKLARLQLAQATHQTLQNALNLLGIEPPERM